MTRKTNRSFLYTHLMRWEPYQVEGARGLAWIKTLARDEDTGALSALIRFDPGFKQPKATSTWPLDMLVLEGEMTCGDRHFQKSTFHYRPAGAEYGPIETREGCTRLVFTADSKDKSSEEETFIQSWDEMPWQNSYSDPSLLKAGVRILREDSVSGYSLLLHGMFTALPALQNEAFVHDHLEEVFLIDGEMEDYLGDIDGHIMWVPGTYVCRDPFDSLHGDTVRHRLPLVNVIRRGWVGDDLLKRRQSEATQWSNVPAPGFVE